MARTGTNENKEANQQMSQVQQDQVARANAATDAYNKELDAYEAQGNPYEDPQYKAKERLLTASASHAQEKGAESQIEDAAMRTGMNTGSVPYWRKALGVEGERAAADANVAQDATDYQNAQGWKQWILGARLAPTGANTQMFSTATQGRDAALGNLTQLGIASYGPWNSLISAAGGAASAALGNPSGFGGCWIAERIYGVDDNRTHLLRLWLNSVWARTSHTGRAVMTVYGLVGRKVAKSDLLCSLLKPLFERGLVCAEAWKRNALCLEVR